MNAAYGGNFAGYTGNNMNSPTGGNTVYSPGTAIYNPAYAPQVGWSAYAETNYVSPYDSFQAFSDTTYGTGPRPSPTYSSSGDGYAIQTYTVVYAVETIPGEPGYATGEYNPGSSYTNGYIPGTMNPGVIAYNEYVAAFANPGVIAYNEYVAAFANPGIAVTNPYIPGYTNSPYSYTNPGTPGGYNYGAQQYNPITAGGYNPGNPAYNTGSGSSYSGNTQVYNAPNSGKGTYNVGSPGGYAGNVPNYNVGNVANYNPGNLGALAPYISAVVNYWDYPDDHTYPVVVPSGGIIVVKIE